MGVSVSCSGQVNGEVATMPVPFTAVTPPVGNTGKQNIYPLDFSVSVLSTNKLLDSVNYCSMLDCNNTAYFIVYFLCMYVQNKINLIVEECILKTVVMR